MEPVKAVAEIPTGVYITIGIMVLANLSVLVTLATMLFKAGMFVADTKTGIKDAKDCAVRSHRRQDKAGIAGGGED